MGPFPCQNGPRDGKTSGECAAWPWHRAPPGTVAPAHRRRSDPEQRNAHRSGASRHRTARTGRPRRRVAASLADQVVAGQRGQQPGLRGGLHRPARGSGGLRLRCRECEGLRHRVRHPGGHQGSRRRFPGTAQLSEQCVRGGPDHRRGRSAGRWTDRVGRSGPVGDLLARKRCGTRCRRGVVAIGLAFHRQCRICRTCSYADAVGCRRAHGCPGGGESRTRRHRDGGNRNAFATTGTLGEAGRFRQPHRRRAGTVADRRWPAQSCLGSAWHRRADTGPAA